MFTGFSEKGRLISLSTLLRATPPSQPAAANSEFMKASIADDVQNGLFVGCNLKDAIDKATAKWMGWTIGRITAKETGIPRGMAYLTGFVVQAAIDDEIYI
jgi:hypothetical protein